MKQVLILSMIIISLSTGTSCNKTFHCTCTDTTTNKVTYDGEVKSMYESTARPQCDQHSSQVITCKTIKK